MYNALKIPGRPVELVKIAGENHHIVTCSRHIKRNNTIPARFDMWLKNQPQ